MEENERLENEEKALEEKKNAGAAPALILGFAIFGGVALTAAVGYGIYKGCKAVKHAIDKKRATVVDDSEEKAEVN